MPHSPNVTSRRRAGFAVHDVNAQGAHRLRLQDTEIDPAATAALLRLDPIADREEFAALAAWLASEHAPTLESLTDSGRPEVLRLGMRVSNLGVDRFALWARDEAGSVLDAVCDQDVRCVVVDLGSLPTREEQSLVAGAVLGELWRRRQERQPILIVIDEATRVQVHWRDLCGCGDGAEGVA